MKAINVTVLVITLAFTPCYGAESPWFPTTQVTPKETSLLKTEIDKLGYAIGVDTGRNFFSPTVQFGQEDFLLGLTEAFSGNKLFLSEYDIREAKNTYQSIMSEDSNFKIIPGNVSYALGVSMGRDLKLLGIKLNLDALSRGFRNVFSTKPLLMDSKHLNLYISLYQGALMRERNRTTVKEAKD